MPTNVLLFPVLPKNRTLNRDAWLADILEHVETRRRVIILFVDNSLFCRRYVARNTWLKAMGVEVVLIDDDIQEHFEINLCPRFDIFIDGDPEAQIVGTATHEEFLKIHRGIFGASDRPDPKTKKAPSGWPDS